MFLISISEGVHMYSCFSFLGQGFFERGKWPIVLEGKCHWQESRKWSDGLLCAIGQDVECRIRGFGGKAPGTETEPSYPSMTVIIMPLCFVFVYCSLSRWFRIHLQFFRLSLYTWLSKRSVCSQRWLWRFTWAMPALTSPWEEPPFSSLPTTRL